jgi:hypothetical protein
VTVAVDAVGTADVTAYPGGTSATFNNLTIGAGLTNSALLVFIAFGASTGPTGISVTWDGVAMSPIAGASITESDIQGYFYGLVNPHAGNKTLAVSWTGTSAYSIDALSLSGVDQVNPFQNVTSNGNASSGTPSVTVTSAIGDYVFAGFASAATGTATNQTQLFFDTGSSYPVASAAYAAGAATVTLTSDNGTGRFFAIGVDIKAAAAVNLRLGNAILDSGLNDLHTNADKIYVCSQQPTDFTTATSTYALGNKNFGVGNVFGAPATGSPGRSITSIAITDGSVTANGTVSAWAVVDSVNSLLLASGPLTGGLAVTAGQTFSLSAMTIREPGQ